jgi:DNA-binding transcriptional LysR family regulator
MISPWLVEEDIARSKLVHVLPEARGETFVVHAVYLPTRNLPARIRAFIDHCASEVPRVFGMHPPTPARAGSSSGTSRAD